MRVLRRSWTSLLLAVMVSVVVTAAPGQNQGARAAGQAGTKAKPAATAPTDVRLDALKRDAAAEVDGLKDLTQQMVDELFSFSEPGFQEVETAKYCTDILRKNGFKVEDNVVGIPTAWLATWGSGSR
jgi:hypothetical protein